MPLRYFSRSSELRHRRAESVCGVMVSLVCRAASLQHFSASGSVSYIRPSISKMTARIMAILLFPVRRPGGGQPQAGTPRPARPVLAGQPGFFCYIISYCTKSGPKIQPSERHAAPHRNAFQNFFKKFDGKALTNVFSSAIITKHSAMRNCVKVARQTLTLFVWVRILVRQPPENFGMQYCVSGFF